MFKFWKIEKRRRATVIRETMARRTLIRANPQYGPFRPTDIYECSSDSEDGHCLHSQLPGLIELWMYSMHQALLGKSFRPISIPRTLVLEIWRN